MADFTSLENQNSVIQVKVESQEGALEKETRKPREGPPRLLTVLPILAIIFGLLSGFLLAKGKSKIGTGVTNIAKMVKTEKEQGSTDTRIFSDSAEGVLERNPGTVSQEGTHMLIRNPNDPSQTAFLTSSVVDLDQFIGKKVQIWGQTFKSEHAAWLMDVGRIKTVE